MTKKHPSAFNIIQISIAILVISIAIAGYVSAQRIVRQNQVQAARSLTKGSIVNSIPSLSLWLETSLDESVTNAANSNVAPSNNDYVSAWNDIDTQSTSRINVTQGTQANQPKYQTDGIGGLPSLSFDGGDWLNNSTSVPISAGDDDYTMVVVWRATSFSGGPVIISQGDGSSASRNAQFWINSTGTQHGFSSLGNDYYSTSPSTVTVGTNYISIIKIDNSLTENTFLYTNSNSVNNGHVTTVSSLDVLTNDFSVGARASVHNIPFTGLISEVMIFSNALEHSDIIDIIAYLSKKYRIKLN